MRHQRQCRDPHRHLAPPDKGVHRHAGRGECRIDETKSGRRVQRRGEAAGCDPANNPPVMLKFGPVPHRAATFRQQPDKLSRRPLVPFGHDDGGAGKIASLAAAGSVVVESIFAWPGIGDLLVRSAILRDYPVLQFGVLSVAVAVIVINAVVDIAYAFADPRIRLAKG